jgi:hypothetical protein
MVLKELPGKKASSEGNPLLTVTTKVGMTNTDRKQQSITSWFGILYTTAFFDFFTLACSVC